MKIPKRFKLMGQTIEIVYDSTISDMDGCAGLAKYRWNQIVLQPDTNGVKRPLSKIEQTFCHELVHWIFYMASENKLRANEKLVDTIAGLLHQALSTMEHEDND